MNQSGKERIKLSVMLKNLGVYIRNYKLALLLLFCITVFSVVCNLFTVIYIKKIVDRALHKNALHLVSSIAIAIAILIVGSICSYLSSYLRGKLSVRVCGDLRKDAIMHIENTRVASLEKHTSGDMVARLNEDAFVIEKMIADDLANYIYYPLMIISAGIYMALMNLQLFFITYLCVPIVLVLVNLLGTSLNRHSRKYNDELANSNTLFFEMIRGIQTLKTYNALEFMSKRYEKKLNDAFQTGMECERLRVLNYSSIINILRVLPYVICIVYGGKMVFDGQIQVSVIIAYTQLLDYTINPSIMMSQLITNFRSVIGAMDRVFEVMELPLEESSKEPLVPKNLIPIRFDQVSFSYHDGQRVLENLSFSLEKNSTLTFVGPSGCGKSTIIKLICRFYEASAGKVELYGNDIKQFSIKELRKQIALVSQDIFLFPDTIANNIAYGGENISLEEVIAAAKKASAHEFIMDLPQGYQTSIGELGSKLSGGQRQRIAIARAFVKNASIILLDEPTSALDFYAQSRIREALDDLMKDKSVIKVTHHLYSIKDEDMVCAIKDGTIVQQGKHKELLQEDGVYQMLYRSQITGEVFI